jgi:hypothetical protein
MDLCWIPLILSENFFLNNRWLQIDHNMTFLSKLVTVLYDGFVLNPVYIVWKFFLNNRWLQIDHNMAFLSKLVHLYRFRLISGWYCNSTLVYNKAQMLWLYWIFSYNCCLESNLPSISHPVATFEICVLFSF